MMTIQDLLDLSKTIAAPLFAGKTYPWEALAEIGDFILQLGPTLPAEEYEQRGENIWIARDAKIFDSAYIAGPCIIDLSKTIAAPLFAGKTYPWEALAEIGDFILQLGPTLPAEEYEQRGENIWIARDAKIFDSAYIAGPCIIDHGAELRQCAFVRGNAIVGKNAVVGNSCELKNVVLFDNVQTPHFNYVGDSILGYKSHMGAGSITSNVKSDKTLVVIKNGAERIETGRKKVGAILGDYVEVGCNSVLNPGTVIGRHSNIYPVSCVRGVIPADSILKSSGEVVHKK